jgi:hypothetical protein
MHGSVFVTLVLFVGGWTTELNRPWTEAALVCRRTRTLKQGGHGPSASLLVARTSLLVARPLLLVARTSLLVARPLLLVARLSLLVARPSLLVTRPTA